MSNPEFDFDYLRQLVRTKSAVILEPYKFYLADLHLTSIAQQAGHDSIKDFIEQLKQTPFGDWHTQAIEALMIHETSFFRDRHPFEVLRQSVLPTLIRNRSPERALTIWCAACSTGQEPYSIAMLIREHFPQLENWEIRLIASDISGKALARANLGRYSTLEVNRGLSEAQRDRYFQCNGSFWQVRDELRQMVTFQQINLIHPWTMIPTVDIIFLRNVLIYFNVETKQSILRKMRQYMREDSYLFLGSGETTFHLDPMFEPVHNASSLYHRLRTA